MRTNSRVTELADVRQDSGGGGPAGQKKEFSAQGEFLGEVMKAPRRPAVARLLVSSEFIEQLESRQMLAVGLTDGVLSVVGSQKADNISVTRAGGNIVVKMGRLKKSFAAGGGGLHRIPPPS